jgi:uncharacterized protein (DUF2164 family)
MEITTIINKEENLRIHKIKGELTLEILLRELGNIYSNQEFREDMNSLWDIREAEVNSFSAEHVEKVKDLVTNHWGTSGKSKSALVVSKDIAFGLSRMYEVFIEQDTKSRVMVFRDYEKAKAWVKL